jgi:hypothetical protein
MKDYIKRECIYYDYGRTCPTAYGAFCAKKKCGMNYVLCNNCKQYKKERRVKERRNK